MNNKIKRLALIVPLLSAAALASIHSAQAQMVCQISLEIIEGGRASGGPGTLICDGQSYTVRVNGLGSVGVIGRRKVSLVGEVRNLRQVSDIEGTYSGPGGSMTISGGMLVAANQKGVQLVFGGKEVELEQSLNLEALQIRLQQ